MLKKLILFVGFSPLFFVAQETEKYASDYANFFRAEELYEKEKLEITTTTTTIQEKKVLNYTKPD
jgi:hypothetical protein